MAVNARRIPCSYSSLPVPSLFIEVAQYCLRSAIVIKYEQILFIQFCMCWCFRKPCGICMDVHPCVYWSIAAVKVLLRIIHRIFFYDRLGTLSEKTTAGELPEPYLTAPRLLVLAVISQLQFTRKNYEKMQQVFSKHSSKNHSRATESPAWCRVNPTRFYLTARKFFSCSVFSELSHQIVCSYLLSKLL